MFFKKKEQYISVELILHCPDGLDEIQGYNIPKDIYGLIKAVNFWNKQNGYSFTLRMFDFKRSINELLCKEK